MCVCVCACVRICLIINVYDERMYISTRNRAKGNYTVRAANNVQDLRGSPLLRSRTYVIITTHTCVFVEDPDFRLVAKTLLSP